MSDKPFVAEACPPMLHASASNGLSVMKTHIENARVIDPLEFDYTVRFGWRFHVQQTVCCRGLPNNVACLCVKRLSEIETHIENAPCNQPFSELTPTAIT
jgi:hypothetical protein